MTTVTKYATSVTEVEDSRFNSVSWSNLANAVGNTDLSAFSEIGTSGGVKFMPSQLYAKGFDFTLPSTFSLKTITIEYQISKSGKVDAKVPDMYVVFGELTGHESTTYATEDKYRIGESNKLGDVKQVISGSISYSTLVQEHINLNTLTTSGFGVILSFDYSSIASTGYVMLDWVRITLEYNEPVYVFNWSGAATRSVDALVEAFGYSHLQGYSFNVSMLVANTNSNVRETPDVETFVKIPLGLKVLDITVTRGSYDESTGIWTTNFGSSNSASITFKLRGVSSGLKKITATSDVFGEKTAYVQINSDVYYQGGDYRTYVSHSDMRKGVEGYFDIYINAISTSEDLEYDFWVNDETCNFTRFELDTSRTSTGVSLVEGFSSTGVQFKVPENTEVDIYMRAYLYPPRVGDNTLTIEANVTGEYIYHDFEVDEPYKYEIDLASKYATISYARIITQIETGAYVLPCKSNEYDNYIVVKKPTLRVWTYGDIDYIGPVALEQTHYDPKSTYKDTLLDTHYKNKKYMGKKGAAEETITLNIRLHPQDVTTVQGLVDMDKPVPLNTNHLCFEGDALNHRGWAELYSIVAEKTNPSWYDCDISVSYITHNINSRFQITKGSQVSDYFLPNLMINQASSGDEISDWFNVTTTGNYTYDDDNATLSKRNQFPLDEGQYVRMRTKNALSLKAYINLTWNSISVNEEKDNNVSRIFRLIDSDSDIAVLEYEYYDFVKDDSSYTCRVICRRYYKGAYDIILNREINLHTDVEVDESNSEEIPLYGSELIFKIIGDSLTIHDKGLSEKEVYLEDIDIYNGEYYFEIEIINNNTDMDTPQYINYIDYESKELAITSEYSQYYRELLVSPFAVPGKTIVFTRECADGTIFYLHDDGTECTYNLSPYYQYHCGVSLETKDGVQLMNLNNSYQSVYANNGLIKIGFDRLNGNVYIYKYDSISKNYIYVARLQMTKYDDININSFTDDKIEIQVSDSIFTVWRGRPYVQINHPEEDILFDNEYVSVYAERVGDSISEFPTEYKLVDTANLFPACIGSSRNIQSNCVDIEEVELEGVDGKITLSSDASEYGLTDTAVFSGYSETFSDEDCYFVIDGEVLDEPVHQTGVDGGSIEFSYQFTSVGEHTVQAVIMETGGFNNGVSNTVTVNVVDDTWNMTVITDDNITYMEEDFKVLLTYAGEPYEGADITFVANGLSYVSKYTDSDGIARLNNRLDPGEYLIKASYVDDNETLAEASAEITIKKGWCNIDLQDKNGTSLSETTVSRGSYVEAVLTNSLDPDDDDVEESETHISNKACTITVNGVSYPRITDSNGRCKLNINLMPNTYDIKVVFSGSAEYEANVKNFEMVVVE